jgi:DNA-binding MarR family transcriptional regulator
MEEDRESLDMEDGELSLAEYRSLAEFRHQLRRFLRFSEDAARAVNLEPQHYQVLLAVKGYPDGRTPTIGDLAERLQLRHHSVVELVDRLEDRGLVQRRRDEIDRRQVFLDLTSEGEAMLRGLAYHHRQQLQLIAPALIAALQQIVEEQAAFDRSDRD